jgi:hypothetical protein
VPVWILQNADQRVDEWLGIGTSPIFTQYLDKQCNWMAELLDEVQWPERFRVDCKPAFSQKLAAACAATKNRDASYYVGKWSWPTPAVGSYACHDDRSRR